MVVSVLDFTISLASASRADESVIFASQVYVTCDDLPALVDIEAGPAIEDSGDSLEHSDLLGTVSSRRSLLSVALGLVVAIAWLEEGGGELSGSGLDSVFLEKDVQSLVVRFSIDQGDGKEGIEQLARSMADPSTDIHNKAVLHARYLTLNPVAIRREIIALGDALAARSPARTGIYRPVPRGHFR